jgi:hypothetical protein
MLVEGFSCQESCQFFSKAFLNIIFAYVKSLSFSKLKAQSSKLKAQSSKLKAQSSKN